MSKRSGFCFSGRSHSEPSHAIQSVTSALRTPLHPTHAESNVSSAFAFHWISSHGRVLRNPRNSNSCASEQLDVGSNDIISNRSRHYSHGGPGVPRGCTAAARRHHSPFVSSRRETCGDDGGVDVTVEASSKPPTGALAGRAGSVRGCGLGIDSSGSPTFSYKLNRTQQSLNKFNGEPGDGSSHSSMSMPGRFGGIQSAAWHSRSTANDLYTAFKSRVLHPKRYAKSRRTRKIIRSHAKLFRDMVDNWSIRDLHCLVVEYESSSAVRDLTSKASKTRGRVPGLSADMLRLHQSAAVADIILLYKDTLFPAHLSFLVSRSSYFRELLFNASIPAGRNSEGNGGREKSHSRRGSRNNSLAKLMASVNVLEPVSVVAQRNVRVMHHLQSLDSALKRRDLRVLPVTLEPLPGKVISPEVFGLLLAALYSGDASNFNLELNHQTSGSALSNSTPIIESEQLSHAAPSISRRTMAKLTMAASSVKTVAGGIGSCGATSSDFTNLLSHIRVELGCFNSVGFDCRQMLVQRRFCDAVLVFSPAFTASARPIGIGGMLPFGAIVRASSVTRPSGDRRDGAPVYPQSGGGYFEDPSGSSLKSSTGSSSDNSLNHSNSKGISRHAPASPTHAGSASVLSAVSSTSQPQSEFPCHLFILAARCPFFRNLIARRLRPPVTNSVGDGNLLMAEPDIVAGNFDSLSRMRLPSTPRQTTSSTLSSVSRTFDRSICTDGSKNKKTQFSVEENTTSNENWDVPLRIVLDESVIPRQYAPVLLHAIYTGELDLEQALSTTNMPTSSLSEVQAIASGKSLPSPLQEATEIYQIARFIEFSCLAQSCEDVIVEHLTVDSLMSVHAWSCEPFGSAYVRRHCIRYLVDHFSVIAASQMLYDIDEPMLVEALRSDFVQASELEILQAVVKWGEQQLIRRLEEREPNILNGTAHSISRKGIRRGDLSDSELREIMANVMPLVRTDYILPHYHSSLHDAMTRGLVACPPLDLPGHFSMNCNGQLEANSGSLESEKSESYTSKSAGEPLWVHQHEQLTHSQRPRLFIPYFEEAKYLLRTKLAENPTMESQLAHHHHPFLPIARQAPDNLYMVEDFGTRRSDNGEEDCSLEEAEEIAVPDVETLAAVERRISEILKSSPTVQKGLACNCSYHKRQILKQVRLRVLREFEINDSALAVLNDISAYYPPCPTSTNPAIRSPLVASNIDGDLEIQAISDFTRYPSLASNVSTFSKAYSDELIVKNPSYCGPGTYKTPTSNKKRSRSTFRTSQLLPPSSQNIDRISRSEPKLMKDQITPQVWPDLMSQADCGSLSSNQNASCSYADDNWNQEDVGPSFFQSTSLEKRHPCNDSKSTLPRFYNNHNDCLQRETAPPESNFDSGQLLLQSPPAARPLDLGTSSADESVWSREVSHASMDLINSAMCSLEVAEKVVEGNPVEHSGGRSCGMSHQRSPLRLDGHRSANRVPVNSRHITTESATIGPDYCAPSSISTKWPPTCIVNPCNSVLLSSALPKAGFSSSAANDGFSIGQRVHQTNRRNVVPSDRRKDVDSTAVARSFVPAAGASSSVARELGVGGVTGRTLTPDLPSASSSVLGSRVNAADESVFAFQPASFHEIPDIETDTDLAASK